METMVQQNSDYLPENSAFGTDFSNPEWTKNICIGSDERRCGVKLRNMEAMLRSAPAYKTSTCIIQKNLSTILEAIMCFLFNEQKFREAHSILSLAQEENPLVFDREELRRFCLQPNDNVSFMHTQQLLNMNPYERNDWLYLAIVRDPVDKFLSGYVDKCIRLPHIPEGYCNGCGRNLTCFIITEYERIMENSYSEFISSTFEDRHFFPQSWRCNFDRELYRYKLMLYNSAQQHDSKLVDNLLNFLRTQMVPEASLQFIRDQIKDGKTGHSTSSSDARAFYEQRLRSSPFLLEYVIRMYYWDFKIFGFDLPTSSY